MFSRLKRLGAGAALLACVAAGGCAKKAVPVGGAGPGLVGSDTGCMDRAGQISARYFDGRATEAETGEVWDCAARSLTLFVERTRGDSQGVYTPGELRAFIEKYFLTKVGISDGFLREAMEFKRALIGGSIDALTLDELERAKRMIAVFRRVSIGMGPHMPLTPERAAALTAPRLEAALAALRSAAREIGALFEDTGIPYSFTRMKELMTELEAFHAEGAAKIPGIAVNGRMATKVRENLASIRVAKTAILGTPIDGIGGNEWTAAFAAGASWYSLLLRARAFEARHPGRWMEPEPRGELMALVREAVGLLDAAIARHPRQLIAFDELDRILDVALPEGLVLNKQGVEAESLPEDERGIERRASLATVKGMLRPVVLRMMSGPDFGSTGRAAKGLTRQALKRAWGRVEHWHAGQRYLDAVFALQARDGGGNSAGAGVGVRPSALRSLGPTQLAAAGLLTREEAHDPMLIDAASRLGKFLATDRPWLSGDDLAMSFLGARTEARHTLHNATTVNWILEVARVLVSAYADAKDRAEVADDFKAGVTFSEFEVFVKDILAFAGELKFLDRDDRRLAANRFREAALFTQASDGDALFTAREGTHLLAMMFSGKLLSVELHDEIMKAGCKVLGKDPWDSTLIDASCYRHALFRDYARFWRRMPGLVAYYRDLSDAGRRAFQDSIEIVARKLGVSPQPMSSADSEGYVMAAQYVESVFSRFDADESGALDWEEAEAAFPVFRRSLEEVTCAQGHCLTGEKDLMAVFTYLLANGQAPTTGQFVRWRYFPFFRSLYADRGRLMAIFAQLSAAGVAGQ